ncbi:MAG: sensor histidine kinase [Bacteroidetes bacterium]|nr:sensor histidine kinase [Bacteroidota bacterium]
MHDPAIFISRVEKIFEVHLGSKKIYSFGKFTPDKKIPSMGLAWHLIKVPNDFSGKTLTFHIRTDGSYIGTYGDIELGSINTFLNDIVKDSFNNTIVGVASIFAGIIFFIILISLGYLKPFVGLIIFQISTGIWILTNSNLTQMLLYVPMLMFYSQHIALFTSAIGFFIFAGEIIELKYKIIPKRMTHIHLIYLLSAIIIDIVVYPDTVDTIVPFLILVSANGLILLWFILASARKGNLEARILLSALAIYIALALVDIVNYINKVVLNRGAYQINYAQYGALCLYILFFWIIILRYLNANKQNLAAKEEVLKNQQIALEAVRKEKAAQKQFTHNLILSQESERKRIAGELHDSIGQELLIIKNRALLGLEDICNDDSRRDHLSEISSLSSQAIKEVRQITHNLRPYQLDRVGLTKALQSLIERLQSSSEIKFKMFVDNIDNLFPSESEINIYRIVQEGINNIMKHSEAASAVLMISKEESNVCITVEDNGKGFLQNQTGNVKSENVGFGLSGINERAQILGAVIEINSKPGKGTILKLNLPVKIKNEF